MFDDARDLAVEDELEAWARGESTAKVSPDLGRKVRGALTPSLVPVKPIPSADRLAFLFLAIFVAGASGLVALIGRVGLELMTPIQIAGVSMMLMAGGILFARKLAEEMIPGSRRGAPLWVVLTLGSTFVFGGLAILFPWQTRGMNIVDGWPCAAMEVAILIPAIAVFCLVARWGTLFASAELGATLSGLAAFLVLIPVQFRCMFQDAPHLLIWHAGTALLLTGIGAVGGALCRSRQIS